MVCIHMSLRNSEDGGVGVGGRESIGDRGGGVYSQEDGGVGVGGRESIGDRGGGVPLPCQPLLTLLRCLSRSTLYVSFPSPCQPLLGRFFSSSSMLRSTLG